IPLPGDIALKWAETGEYPLEDRWNLARVAQYMALGRGPKWPRDQLASALLASEPAEVEERDDVLVALADLPFATYVTTTYDELLGGGVRTRAVAGRSERRRPRADFCRWHDALRTSSLATVFDEDPHYVPSPDEPFVFHLHGQVGVTESLVVT